jgi:phospholipase/lecithinase/hemolysin
VTQRLWVIGDSWSDPRSYPWAPAQNWAALVAERLGVGLINSAVSGSGYAATNGTPNFPAQAAQGTGAGADVVIVFGSLNDPLQGHTPDEVRAAAATTYGLIGRLCVGAPLLVVGPQWGALPLTPALLATRDAVAAAAAAAGADYIDPSSWFAGRPDLMLNDYHPTPDGHAIIADRVGHDVGLALFAPPTLRA